MWVLPPASPPAAGTGSLAQKHRASVSPCCSGTTKPPWVGFPWHRRVLLARPQAESRSLSPRERPDPSRAAKRSFLISRRPITPLLPPHLHLVWGGVSKQTFAWAQLWDMKNTAGVEEGGGGERQGTTGDSGVTPAMPAWSPSHREVGLPTPPGDQECQLWSGASLPPHCHPNTSCSRTASRPQKNKPHTPPPLHRTEDDGGRKRPFPVPTPVAAGLHLREFARQAKGRENFHPLPGPKEGSGFSPMVLQPGSAPPQPRLVAQLWGGRAGLPALGWGGGHLCRSHLTASTRNGSDNPVWNNGHPHGWSKSCGFSSSPPRSYLHRSPKAGARGR